MHPNPLSLGKALRQKGLALGHFNILFALWQHGGAVPPIQGLTFSDLVNLTGFGMSTLREEVADLEHLGLVKKKRTSKSTRGGFRGGPPMRMWLSTEGFELVASHLGEPDLNKLIPA